MVYDFIWYDMIWYDMIWYDIIWWNVSFHCTIWYCTILCIAIWYDVIWCHMMEYCVGGSTWPYILCYHAVSSNAVQCPTSETNGIEKQLTNIRIEYYICQYLLGTFSEITSSNTHFNPSTTLLSTKVVLHSNIEIEGLPMWCIILLKCGISGYFCILNTKDPVPDSSFMFSVLQFTVCVLSQPFNISEHVWSDSLVVLAGKDMVDPTV